MDRKTSLELDHGRLFALAQALRQSDRPERARHLTERLAAILAQDEAGLGSGRVGLGSLVAFRDLGSGASFEYRITLPAEADIARGAVSVLSPLGAALIGRSEGERFSYQSPGGRVEVRVERQSHAG